MLDDIRFRADALTRTVETTVHKCLGSRKFLAASAAFTAAVHAGQTNLAAAVAAAYVVVEGFIDSK